MGAVRLLSFQSKEVLESLFKNGIYHCNVDLSRERRNYSEDIKQLDGMNPIWCFTPKNISSYFVKLDVKDKFIQKDFINGYLFQTFRCEMSLPSGESLNNFVLMELEVSDELPKVGITHNSYNGAVVIPEIKVENLIATYTVEYNDDDDIMWYYPEVKVTNVYRENRLFKHNFACKKTSKI